MHRGILCTSQVCVKLINRVPLTCRMQMAQHVSGALVYTKLYRRLMEILKRIGIPDKERRILVHLYWNQKAVVSSKGETTKEIEIKKGWRQGCVLIPGTLQYILRNNF